MSEEPQGRRAVNKAAKLSRIRAAARDLFIEKGYDGATMRDLAVRGGIGFGTIFDYASSKRDLLFLIFNPSLVQALDQGYQNALHEVVYLDQLMKVFEQFYRLYREEPNLSRYLLRELNFYKDGAEAEKFLNQRADFLGRLRDLTAGAQRDGQLSAGGDCALIAQLLLSVFAWEVRRWISVDPLDLDQGLSRLRTLLDVMIAGIGSKATDD